MNATLGPTVTKPNTRMSISLLDDVANDLNTLQERTGLSKVDVINRAITIYRFIDAQLRDGKALLVQEEDGSTSYVHLV